MVETQLLRKNTDAWPQRFKKEWSSKIVRNYTLEFRTSFIFIYESLLNSYLRPLKQNYIFYFVKMENALNVINQILYFFYFVDYILRVYLPIWSSMTGVQSPSSFSGVCVRVIWSHPWTSIWWWPDNEIPARTYWNPFRQSPSKLLCVCGRPTIICWDPSGSTGSTAESALSNMGLSIKT